MFRNPGKPVLQPVVATMKPETGLILAALFATLILGFGLPVGPAAESGPSPAPGLAAVHAALPQTVYR